MSWNLTEMQKITLTKNLRYIISGHIYFARVSQLAFMRDPVGMQFNAISLLNI